MKKYLLILLSLFYISAVSAEKSYFPERPESWVNDYAGVFNTNELYLLNKKLATYEDTTSTQIYVVTMNEHGNIPIAMMGAQIGEKWKVGQEQEDNGLVILIYFEDREITIQTGYGLEEYIPDAIAKRIIEKEIKPEFRNNDYLAGIDKATNVIFGLLSGKFSGDEYMKSSGKGGSLTGLLFLLVFAFIFLGNSRRRRYTGVGRGIPFWIAMSMLSGSRNTHSGSWGGFSSGSGGFGGFSGGGGGSFGGGGASGSW